MRNTCERSRIGQSVSATNERSTRKKCVFSKMVLGWLVGMPTSDFSILDSTKDMNAS